MTETNPIRNDTALKLDEAEILARMDGDCQLLADLCELSLAELPGMIQTLDVMVKTDDANAVHRAAHRLKGALSVFGVGPHTEDCLVIEEMAIKGDLSRMPEILNRLGRHLEEFRVAVAALGKEIHARADRR